MIKISHYGICYVGRRSNNEDAILQLKIDPNTYCFAVADGMGGAAAGETASNEVLKQVEIAVNEAFLLTENNEPNLKEVLESAFSDAEKRITELTAKNPELSGMGTTLTVLLINNNRYAWGNIGDSRIYRFYDNKAEQLTIDHTYIEQYRADNQTEVPESIANRYGNIITRAISGNADKPDLFPADEPYCSLKEGMTFLICSDGLINSKIVDSGQVFLPQVNHYSKPKKTTEQLVSKAFHEGSSDNISCIIIQCGKKKSHSKIKGVQVFPFPPEETETTNKNSKKKLWSKLMNNFDWVMRALIIVLFSLLIVLGFRYMKQRYPQVVESFASVFQKTEHIAPPPMVKISQPEHNQVDIPKHVQNERGEDSPGVMYTVDDLKRIRQKSLMGLSKLMITFLEDENVMAENLAKPLEFVIKRLEIEKPDYLRNIHYSQPDTAADKSYSKDDTNFLKFMTNDIKDGASPFFANDKAYVVNKSKNNEYVFIQISDLKRFNPQRIDFMSNPDVFAKESGLNNLTALMTGLYFDYFHAAHFQKHLQPLLQYLVVYEDAEAIETYGKPVDEGFMAGAKTTRVLYIQHLEGEDNKRYIDISMSVPDKPSQVLRAGYLVD